MSPALFISLFDALGALGCLLAMALGVQNYRETAVERPFWLVFSFTTGLSTLWLLLLAVEWRGVNSAVLDSFNTSLQAVVIGLFAVGVVGTYAVSVNLKEARMQTEQRASIVSILSRVLRHNFRNDLTVIRGYTAMLVGDSKEAAIVRDKVDDLIGTTEKARKLEKTITASSGFSDVDLESLLEDIAADVRADHPDASITVTSADGTSVQALPSLRTALTELVENAVEHAGDSPDVSLTVTSSDTTVSIRVSDDGPGLPPDEQHILEAGVETPLVHSGGIGLWVASLVVANHNGDLSCQTAGVGSTLTVTLPRQPADSAADDRVGQPGRDPGYDRYQAVYEHDVDGILILDDSQQILDANASAGSLLERSPENLLGRPVSDLLSDSLVETAWPENGTDSVVTDTTTISLPAGTERTVVCTFRPNIALGEHLLILQDPTKYEDIV